MKKHVSVRIVLVNLKPIVVKNQDAIRFVTMIVVKMDLGNAVVWTVYVLINKNDWWSHHNMSFINH